MEINLKYAGRKLAKPSKVNKDECTLQALNGGVGLYNLHLVTSSPGPL